MTPLKKISNRRHIIIPLCALLALALWFQLAWIKSLPEAQQALPYLTIHSLLWFDFSLLLLATGTVFSEFSKPLTKNQWLMVLISPLFFSLLAMIPAPLLETDPYRYLWDGKQLLHGINPYLLSPNDAVSLVDKAWYFDLINHPHIATIYPPLAQAFFAIAAFIAEDSLLLWKILASVLGFASMGLIAATLKNLGQDPRRVLFLAWNPLWIKEISNSGHMDVIMLLPLAAAAWALSRQKEKVACIFWGLSILGKWASLALLPAFAAGLKRRASLPLIPLTVFLGLLPFMLWTRWSAPFESLGVFSKDWLFHAFIFDLVLKGLMKTGLNYDTAALAGKVLAAAALGAFSLFLWRRVNTAAQALAGAYWLAVILLIFSQAIFPWYITWVLLFAPFAKSLKAAWIWTLIAPLSYLYYINTEPIYWLKYLSFTLLTYFLWQDFKKETWAPKRKNPRRILNKGFF